MTVVVNVLKTEACPYCPQASEVARRVASTMKDVEVKETYLDKDPKGHEIAMKHHIRSVPTVLVNDKVKFIGVPPEGALKKAIEEEK